MVLFEMDKYLVSLSTIIKERVMFVKLNEGECHSHMRRVWIQNCCCGNITVNALLYVFLKLHYLRVPSLSYINVIFPEIHMYS